jgi:hypothetical protein
MKSILTDLEMYQEILGEPGSKNSLDNREQLGLVELCKLQASTIEKLAPKEQVGHYEYIGYKRLHSRDATKGARDVTPKMKELT